MTASATIYRAATLLERIERWAGRGSLLYRWARKRRGICPSCSGPWSTDPDRSTARREWHPCGACPNCVCFAGSKRKAAPLPNARVVIPRGGGGRL